MDWSRGHVIGHGASGTVSTATLRSTGEILAVKSAKLSKSEPLQREAEILSTLNHPNVVSYKGHDVSKGMFNLMMEYAPDGTIADAILRGPGLDEPTISRHARQIVTGLEYLHSRGIVHCDIKTSNVLLIEGEAKIADFGCAKAAGEAVIGGTPMYMSPEAARGRSRGFPADVWAVGCTVIEMATGKSPWRNCNSTKTLRRIAFSGETPEVPGCLSDTGKDFLSKCLRVDPNERWTAGELLGHRFIEECRVLGDGKERTCSPTCVLDQGIWSLCEEEEEGVSVCEMDGGDLWERMNELCVNSGKDNWEWGRDG